MTSVGNTKALIGVAEKVHKILCKAKALKILNQEIVIKVPELTGEYSAAIQINRKSPFARKIRFPFHTIRMVRAHSLPVFTNEARAVLKSKDGYEVLIDRISQGTDKLLLSFEYEIEDAKFISNLVQRNVQRETLKGDEEVDEYWMHAQLKHLAVLKTIYGRLDLRDMDFMVDVGVYQDLKTAIPSDFIRNLRIIGEWIRTHDRTKKFKLSYAHLRFARRSYTGREDQILADLQNLFFPKEFKRFVEVTEPYRYYESVRGSDFYDIPFQAFPKTMKVISRTDLNLETPAAKGKLIYKKKDLRDEVSRLLGIFKKAKKD